MMSKTKLTSSMPKQFSDFSLTPKADHLAMLDEMARDPVFGAELKMLQMKVRSIVAGEVDSLVKALGKEKSRANPTVNAVPGATLARGLRSAGLDIATRRKYATMRMTAAVLNRNNPRWNPGDPLTDEADFTDDIVLLTQMNFGS